MRLRIVLNLLTALPGRSMRRLTLVAAGCMLGGTPLMASAQDAATPQTPVQAAAHSRFEIAAQPLPDALRLFARQAGMRVRVDARAAEGVRSRALSGVLPVEEAL